MTEQQWLGNSPYTHPSMPTPKVFDLSAALEDAEGRAMVEKIHDPSNPRLAGISLTTAEQGTGTIELAP